MRCIYGSVRRPFTVDNGGPTLRITLAKRLDKHRLTFNNFDALYYLHVLSESKRQTLTMVLLNRIL
jgi:hypothetical protein